MKWTLNEPIEGDIVRVKLGNIYHYGIYVNDDEIIQFGLPPTTLNRDASKIEVCSTNLETFLCGKFLEVGLPERKEKKKIHSREKIVGIAKSRLGEKGYHIIYNNCEHFVHQCAFNEHTCSQIEEVRAMFKKFPFVNVFVKKFPFKTRNDDIFPLERKEEIQNCKNEDVKKEKFYSWKLLEYGILHSLGLDIKNLQFSKENGKWNCDKMYFSLSHTANIVAVVVARNEVGIDVEGINLERFAKIPSKKLLSEEECGVIANEPAQLNRIWTIKEALFKKANKKSFNPCEVSTLNDKFITKTIIVDDKKYFLSVATNDLPFVKFYLDEDIILEN